MKFVIKSVFAFGLIAAAISSQSFAGDLFKFEFYNDNDGLHIGTDSHGHHNDYRHQKDLYVRPGYTSQRSGECHVHVERNNKFKFHRDVQCHTHKPWLHPSIDYAVR